MSVSDSEYPKQQELADDAPQKQVGGDISVDELRASDKSDENPEAASDTNSENTIPSPQQQVHSVSALHMTTLFDLAYRNPRNSSLILVVNKYEILNCHPIAASW